MPQVPTKGMEHVRRTLENTVAQESLKLESGLIWLAVAVSGAPFLGLLGTVWGVMSTFGHIAQQGNANLTAMAPGVSAALITTVAGLIVCTALNPNRLAAAEFRRGDAGVKAPPL